MGTKFLAGDYREVIIGEMGTWMSKIDLRETEYRDVDWIKLARDNVQCRAFVNAVMIL
jgi:hypothetical protein